MTTIYNITAIYNDLEYHLGSEKFGNKEAEPFTRLEEAKEAFNQIDSDFLKSNGFESNHESIITLSQVGTITDKVIMEKTININ